MRLTLRRVQIDWEDDGRITYYGWRLMLFIHGKHRAAWNTTGGTTRMWPRVIHGSDENCNRAVSFSCWPIGMLDIWWEPNWRTDEDGECEECRAELGAA